MDMMMTLWITSTNNTSKRKNIKETATKELMQPK